MDIGGFHLRDGWMSCNNMNNILIIYESRIATVNIVENTLRKVLINDTIITSKKVTKVSRDDIYTNDVFFLIRSTDYLSYKIAENASINGKMIIEYIDDDLLNYNKGIFAVYWRKKNLQKVIKIVDYIASPNCLLASSLEKNGRNDRAVEMKSVAQVHNHDNIVSDSAFPIKILYSAGSEHEIYFERYILPILGKLSEKYGEAIQFHFIGVKPKVDIKQYKMHFNYVEYMSYEDYCEYMLANNFDIGIAPLEDSKFNNYKYYNKYLEYSAYGIPAIYSSVEPYTQVIKNNENGILVNNEPEEWLEAIMQMIEHSNLRETIAEKARNDLLDNYNPKSIRNELICKMPKIIAKYPSKQEKVSLENAKIIYIIQRLFENIWKVVYYIKSEDYSFFEMIRRKVAKICFRI